MFVLARMKQYRINLAASSNSYTLGLLCTHARVRVPVAVKKKKLRKELNRKEERETGRVSREYRSD